MTLQALCIVALLAVSSSACSVDSDPQVGAPNSLPSVEPPETARIAGDASSTTSTINPDTLVPATESTQQVVAVDQTESEAATAPSDDAAFNEFCRVALDKALAQVEYLAENDFDLSSRSSAEYTRISKHWAHALAAVAPKQLADDVELLTNTLDELVVATPEGEQLDGDVYAAIWTDRRKEAALAIDRVERDHCEHDLVTMFRERRLEQHRQELLVAGPETVTDPGGQYQIILLPRWGKPTFDVITNEMFLYPEIEETWVDLNVYVNLRPKGLEAEFQRGLEFFEDQRTESLISSEIVTVEDGRQIISTEYLSGDRHVWLTVSVGPTTSSRALLSAPADQFPAIRDQFEVTMLSLTALA